MRLEERINQYSNQLTENDYYIWNYVEKHRKQCENMTIEQLAKECNVSRTTILRFAKKLSLKGYGEFKVRLKMENKKEQNDVSKAVKVCLAYEEMMQIIIQQDYHEIMKAIYDAKRLFVYGNGMVQRTAASELKRQFSAVGRNFFDFTGKTEYQRILQTMNQDDLLVIISLSGESKETIDFAKKAQVRNVPIISMTRQESNSLAQVSTYNLYISTTQLDQTLSFHRYESVTTYFILIEMLFLRYLDYLEGEKDES